MEEIIAHTKKEAPIEACGYLAALDGIITVCYPLSNIDKSREHFSFDPASQFAVLKEARAKGLEIAAVYHSHPQSPARPSEEDIRLAYDPQIVYVIASLAAGKEEVYPVRDINNPNNSAIVSNGVKAFRIRNKAVVPEPLEVIE